MSTTAVTAGQIMDRVASLLNDPNKTDYTYKVQLPYLNMAIEEYCDLMSDANSPFTNLTSLNYSGVPIVIPKGTRFLVPNDYYPPANPTPRYPPDLIEIQEIGERPAGSNGPFIRLPRREFGMEMPPTNSLGYWIFERGVVVFNQLGALIDMEVQLKFIYQGIQYAADENSIIIMIGARTYLSYKTAAFCAMFIGENESRAAVLEERAEESVERTISISNKGRQQIMTRHRPFRAAYKSRGGF